MGNMAGFDANEVGPRTSFELIPKGEYVAIISDSEEKENKKGTGAYLQLTLQIVDGPHEGRFLWERLNMKNPSKTAVEIARKTAGEICRAVGIMSPGDTANLHDIPMRITVGIKKNKETGEMENVIAQYAPFNSSKAALTNAAAGVAKVPPTVAAAAQAKAPETAPATAPATEPSAPSAPAATAPTSTTAVDNPPWKSKTWKAHAKA